MAFDPSTYGVKSAGGFDPNTYGSKEPSSPQDVNVDASHQKAAEYSFAGDYATATRGLTEEGDLMAMAMFKQEFEAAKPGTKLVDPLYKKQIVKTGDDTYTFVPEKATATGAFFRAFAAGQPSAAGAAVGMGVMHRLSSALLASPNIALKGVGLLTAIGGGIAGSIAGSAAKEAVLPTPDEVKAQLARDRKEQKIAAAAGSISSNLPYFGVGGASLAQRATMAGVGGGTPVAIAGAQKLVTGKDMPDDLLEQSLEGAAGGLLLANPRKMGQRLMDVGAAIPGAKSLAKLAPKPKVDLGLSKPTTPITDNLNAKAGQPLPKTQQDAISMALGPEDLALGVGEPAPAIEHGALPNERALLNSEIKAQPQWAIDAQLETQRVRGQYKAQETILAEIERRAAQKEVADAAQVEINDTLGVRRPEPQNAKSSLLAERAAEGVDQVAIPEVQAARQKEFNDRVVKVTENLKAEGVELDRQTAAKLALIKDPQEFNAARQQLIDSVTPPAHEIPKKGPVKSLSDLPEIAGPRDLVGPRAPEPSPREQLHQIMLDEQRAAGWDHNWPFIPMDFGNKTFVEGILADSTIPPKLKKQMFDAAKKLGVHSRGYEASLMPEIAAPKPLEATLPIAKPAKAVKSKVTAPVEAPAKFVGIQEGVPEAGIKSFELFNLTKDIPGHPKDSTVSRETLEKAGFKAPPAPESVPETPVVDAKEAIIQDPNLDADTKIEILQKMANAKPKSSVAALREKLLARKREVASAKESKPAPEPAIEAPKEVAPEPEPIDPKQVLADKLSYLDEQLAAKEITKDEHKALVKEAKANAKKKPTSNEGFANPAVMAHVAAPAAGAAIGYQFGDTQEEKLNNAALGAAIASGSTVAASVLSKNKALVDAIKKGFEEAKAESAKRPTLLQQVMGDSNAKPVTPDEVGAAAAFKHDGSTPVWDRGILKNYPRLADTVEKFTTHVDSLYEVSPKLAGAMRNWMYDSSKLLSDATTRSLGPVTKLRELVGKEQFEGDVWKALREGREDEVLAALDKTPEGKVIADGLREGWIKDRPQILEMLRQANPGDVVYVDGKPTYPNKTIGELDNYWPSLVEDLPGLRKAMGSKYKSDIDIAIAKKKEALGVDSLSDTEVGDIITNLLSKPAVSGNSPGMGNIKQRKLTEIPKEYQKFYAAPDLALAKYYQRAFDSALSRKYIGKANPDGTLPFYGKENEGVFGDILNSGIKDGSITPDGAQRAIENISSFGRSEQGWKITQALAPKLAYLQVAGNLGQPISALANLMDVLNTVAHTTAKDAFAGFFIDPLIRGSKFKTLKDINVQDGITEFYEHSKKSGIATKVMDYAILPFFKKLDTFAKQGIANANLRALERGVKAEAAGNETGYRYDINKGRYSEMYGKEEFAKLADAVRKGEWNSEVINKYAYNRLADVQPISRAEQVIGKSQAGPGLKLAFGLTGFMLRQMNTLRANTLNEWRRGNYNSAVKWVAGYMTMQALAGKVMGELEDAISDKPAAAENRVIGSILATMGLNRYMLKQFLTGDVSSSVGDRLMPGIASLVKDAGHDIVFAAKKAVGSEDRDFLPNSEFVKRIPHGGSIYYDRYGAGAARKETQARSRTQESGDLSKLIDAIEGSGNRQNRK